ncbi:MAG TPA: NfeD family protein [Planctomycetaceae bacterium]|nr:NfeD family protein [Planctomycetaceae bacterium]
MDYSTIAVMLALLTLFLLVAEFFIPSGGLISLVALLCGTISIWGGWKAWGTSSPFIWWTYLIIFLTLIPTVLGTVLVILPKTKYGRKLLLEPTPAGESKANLKARQELEQLIGKRGKTATLHTPGGFVLINDRRHHSESEGLLIEPNTPVVVVGISGTRLVIREIDPAVESDDPLDGKKSPVQLGDDSEADADISEPVNKQPYEADLDFQVPDE